MISIFGYEPTSWLEKASWIAQIVIALATVGGVLFAAGQLISLRKTSQASLLLELDARFDSPEIRGARDLFGSLTGQINMVVSTKNPSANDAAKIKLVCNEWKTALAGMRSTDKEDYIKLIGYLGFFETLGLMVKKKYISEENALDLFKGPLVDVGNSFALHIEERCKEMGVAEGLFEHALSLSKSAAKASKP